MRLYISPCPNDTFMFDALINGKIDRRGLNLEVEYFDIEELNQRAIAGEAEFSKISCAIIPQINDTYTISQSGAALGRGNGPLFVRRRGDTSPIRKVAIPGTHTTANLLMQKLFPEINEREPMLFSQIARSVKQGDFDGGVLIHEGRFLYAAEGLELVADLGVLWEERTGLPLPLGAIAMRRTLEKGQQQLFEELLSESIAYAFAHPQESRAFIKEHAQEMADDVIDAHIALFVNDYSLHLGDEGQQAIDALVG